MLMQVRGDHVSLWARGEREQIREYLAVLSTAAAGGVVGVIDLSASTVLPQSEWQTPFQLE